MIVRGYDPAIGRMLQVDPYAPLYASSTTYNYALNNPVMMNDPTGGYTTSYDADGISDVAQQRMYKLYSKHDFGIHAGWSESYNISEGGGQVLSAEYAAAVMRDLMYDFKYGRNAVSIARSLFGTVINAALRGELSINGMFMTVGYSNRTETIGLSQSDKDKYNIPSSLDKGIVTSPIRKSIQSFLDRNQARRDLAERIKNEIGNTFVGVPIIDSRIGNLKYGAAVTVPGAIRLNFASCLNRNKMRPNYTRDLLRHEYGHILQYQRYGNAFFLVVAPVSAYSAEYASDHMDTWTEREANTLSYQFFQSPNDWNHDEYPIDYDFLNALIVNHNNKAK